MLITQRSEQHHGIFVSELVSLTHFDHGRIGVFAEQGHTEVAGIALHRDLSCIVKADGARFGIQ